MYKYSIIVAMQIRKIIYYKKFEKVRFQVPTKTVRVLLEPFINSECISCVLFSKPVILLTAFRINLLNESRGFQTRTHMDEGS